MGEIGGESAACSRLLAKHARARMGERRPRIAADPDRRDQLKALFLRAASEGDLPGLIATLTADVSVYLDGGGVVTAARKPVVGRDKGSLFLTSKPRVAPEGARLKIEQINGEPGIVTLMAGGARNVVTFDFAKSGFQTMEIVVNPD